MDLRALASRCRAASGAATALPLVAAALSLAACGSGLHPSSEPRPQPAAATPAPVASFAYSPGTVRARLDSRATIRVEGDTTPPDTAVTELYVTLVLGEGAGARPLIGVVDSVLAGGGGRPVAMLPVPAPLRFEGTVEGGAVRVPRPAATATDCSSPAGSILAIARELLPTLPPDLSTGRQWTETVATTSCRGGVVLTTTAVHEYRVAGAAGAGAPVRITRSTRYRLAGNGSQAGEPVTAVGQGSGTGELLVAPVAGRLLGLTTHSTIDITFTGGGRTQHVVQDGRQELQLRW